jgi:hypothetical protein
MKRVVKKKVTVVETVAAVVRRRLHAPRAARGAEQRAPSPPALPAFLPVPPQQVAAGVAPRAAMPLGSHGGFIWIITA